MRRPEMSHSPTYYQDGDASAHFMTPLPQAFSPVAPSPAHLSHSDPSRFRRPEDTPGSDPDHHRHYSHRHSPRYSRHHHHPESLGSDPRPSPASFMSAPQLEDGSIATHGSNSTARKERPRGSLSELSSSYLPSAGEQRRPQSASRTTPKRSLQEDAPVPDDNPDALVMLFRLSIPVPIFAFSASLYTIFALLFAFFLSPLRLCPPTASLKSTSFRTQVCDLLVPALHVHERLVGLHPSSRRRSSSQWVYDADPVMGSAVDRSLRFSVGGLIAVLLLSSFLSVALVLVVWIAAFFWIFAMVLGNPDGTERKDDGRAAVLGVCRWWQRWLSKARVRPS